MERVKKIRRNDEETRLPEAISLKRKKKIRPYLGTGFLAAAAVFIFFPDIAIFDFLPDFIGYILILCGLSLFRDLNDYFGDAYDRFYKVAWISALKFFSFYVVLALVTAQEQADTLLLLSFCFTVFDFVYLIPAWKNLFEGFSYAVTRCDGATFDLKPCRPKRVRFFYSKRGLKKGTVIERKPVNRIEQLRRATVFFVAFKSVMTVLPEFSALSADTSTTAVSLYSFIGVLRLLSMMAVLVFGIRWLILMLRFVFAIKKDAGFLSFYREKYRTDVLTKDHIFIERHLQSALFVASIAFVFRVDLRVDFMYMIPDALMGALLIVTVVILGYHIGKRSHFYAVTGAYSLLSIGVTMFDSYFHHEHSMTAIQTSDEVFWQFVILLILKVVEQAAFVLVMALFLSLMRRVIRSYTGFSVTVAETLEPSEKIRTLHRELERKLKVLFGASVLTAVSKIAVVAFTLESRAGRFLDWITILDFGIAAVFAFLCMKTIREIYTQVQYRFMLM